MRAPNILIMVAPVVVAPVVVTTADPTVVAAVVGDPTLMELAGVATASTGVSSAPDAGSEEDAAAILPRV